MRAGLVAAGCVLAGCGDPHAAIVDAGIDTPPAAAPCAAEFSENFAERWAGPANCAVVSTADGHTTLGLTIPSKTIGTPFAISIDLGAAPGPGTYTAPSLVTPWSADALQEFDMTSCLYHAGTAAVPSGTFTLVLDAIDAGDAGEPHAHGRLDVVLYVLSRPYTYCGETNTERVTVTF